MAVSLRRRQEFPFWQNCLKHLEVVLVIRQSSFKAGEPSTAFVLLIDLLEEGAEGNKTQPMPLEVSMYGLHDFRGKWQRHK